MRNSQALARIGPVSAARLGGATRPGSLDAAGMTTTHGGL
ncbi:hypothetical protein Save01_01831 [Streptomyces avermitilis]